MPGPPTTLRCEICGAEFEAWQRKPTKQPARTCSNACRQKLYRREKKLTAPTTT